MMHRYWGDGMPGYIDSHDYVADDVYGGFIMTAMDYTDRQLGRVRKYFGHSSSVHARCGCQHGTGPDRSEFVSREMFILDNPARLVSRLGLKPANWAMRCIRASPSSSPRPALPRRRWATQVQ